MPLEINCDRQMPETKSITVAVCTYRRFDQLNNCLESLKSQTLPQDTYTLLVIDNSLTKEESIAYRDSLKEYSNLTYVITDKCGIGYARNKALENCNTEFLAFTDDDCIVPDNWIEKILDIFESHGRTIGVAGGRVNPRWGTHKPDWLTGEFLDSLAVLDWGNEEQFVNPLEGKWLLTANGAYRTEALKKAGGFAEHLGRKKNIPMAQEEFAANLEIYKSGYDLLYSPEISVDHAIDASRMTQRWQCYDAFWYAVSSELMSCHTVDMASVEEALESLTHRIDILLADWKDVSSQSSLRKKVIHYRDQGHRAAKEFFQELTCNIPKKDVFNIYQSWPVIYLATPCLNAADTIDRCIMSVVSQAGNFCIRYHVQDGGSVDGTHDKLRYWEKVLHGANAITQCRNVVFSWGYEPDKGMYDALQKSYHQMSIPQHAYMSWINADDFLMPGALATVAKIAEKFPENVHWLCGHTAKFKEDRPVVIKPRVLNREMIKNGLHDGEHLDYLQQEGTFFKKWLWDKGKDTLREFTYAGDWNMWRVFAGHTYIYQVPFPLGCFSIRPGQLSQKKISAYRAEINATIALPKRKKAFKQFRKRLNTQTGIIEIDPVNGSMKAFIRHHGAVIDNTAENVSTMIIRLKKLLSRILPASIKKPLKSMLGTLK